MRSLPSLDRRAGPSSFSTDQAGERPTWTRAEEDAIKDRFPSQRQDEFLLIINLEDGPPSLKWLDPRLIYNDYPTYGSEIAAAAIANTIQRTGAIRQPETAESLAKRKAQQREWKRDRGMFLRSEEGKAALENERRVVLEQIEGIASKARGYGLAFSSRREPSPFGEGVSVWGERHGLSVAWESAFNGLENVSVFRVYLHKNYLRRDTIISLEEPVLLEEMEIGIHVTPSMEIRWRRADRDRQRAFSSAGLADYLMKSLFRHVEE